MDVGILRVDEGLVTIQNPARFLPAPIPLNGIAFTSREGITRSLWAWPSMPMRDPVNLAPGARERCIMFTLGEISIRSASFVWKEDKDNLHRLIVGIDDMDYLDFLRRYNSTNVQHKRCKGINLDGSEKLFFAVYVEDCFDPPIAVVRASGASEAEERFADELDWAHISDVDLKDYEEEPSSLSWNSDGKPYDTSGIMIRELRLLCIETE